MRQKSWYPVVYMFVVTAFFSSILIGFSRFTREMVEANQRIAFEKAVLMALHVDMPQRMSPAEIHRVFLERISPPTPSSRGAYLLMEKDKITGYALPVSGQGFWDEIKGVIGIAADRKTIIGIAFYEQNETPGLGAEITRKYFREQFAGKVLSFSEKPIIVKTVGLATGENEVQAVTGATQTSTRLEKMLNDTLTRWLKGEDDKGKG